MNNRFHFPLIALLIYCPTLSAMNALEKNQRQGATLPQEITAIPLIICFDPTRAEGDPEFSTASLSSTYVVSTALIQALASKSAIVITSRGLWDYIIDVKERGTNRSEQEMVINRLWNECKFDPSEWLIYQTMPEKQVNTLLNINHISKPIGPIAPDKYTIVFIPKSGNFKPYVDQIKKFDSKGESTPAPYISDGELLLGIKTNNLSPIEIPLTREKSGLKTEFKTLFNTITQSDDLPLYLKNILLTRDDFNKDLKGIEPKNNRSWDIYLVGHGLSAKSGNPNIAGITPDKFKELLTFLNDQVKTRTFFYDSCYAGSHKEPYQDPFEAPGKKEIRNKEFNFIIIASTIFDLPSTALLGQFHFTDYFKKLNDYFAPYPSKQDKKLTLSDAVNAITSWKRLYKRETTYDPSLAQIPIIRYPHTGWSTIIDLDNNIFRLNNVAIMQAISEGKKTIDIPKYVSLILLETRYIPIPITINGSDMPILMPIEFNNASYFFKEINAPDVTLDETHSLLKGSFYQMLQLLKAKTNNALKYNVFFIEKLHMKVSKRATFTIASDAQLTFENVIINPWEAITVTYERIDKQKEQKSFKDSGWYAGGSSIDFKKEKGNILNASSLPDAIKNEEVKTPIGETVLSQRDLFQKYELYSDDRYELKEWMEGLSPEDKKKLEAYIESNK
jgi:hypothetical protein